MPDQRASRKLARFQRWVSRTGIITTNVILRSVVIRRFLNVYGNRDTGAVERSD
jgi:hypothetical protein